MKFRYIDDSGHVSTGWIVFGWVEVDVTDWRGALRAWLDLRKELFLEYGVPVSTELHGVKLTGGGRSGGLHHVSPPPPP